MGFKKNLREIILERDNNQCVYCGTKENLTLGHYISRYNNGHGCVDNLQIECRSCNMKNGKENREGGVVKGCWGCKNPTMRKFYRNKQIKLRNRIIGYRFECRGCNDYEIEEANLVDLFIERDMHYDNCDASIVSKGYITELQENEEPSQ